MKLKIFQVGATPLHLRSPDLFDHSSYSAKIQSVRPMNSMDEIVRDSQFNSIKNRKYKIQSLLLDDADINAEQIETQLMGLLGSPVPIISYVSHEPLYKRLGGDCSCSTFGHCCLTWLCATGVITKVQAKQKDYSKEPTLEIEIELVTFWSTMNALSWRWIKSPSNIASGACQERCASLEFSWSLPTCEEAVGGARGAKKSFLPVNYEDDSHLFDPRFLSKMIDFGDCSCDGNCCYGASGSAFSYEGSGKKVRIKSRPDYFNVPPLPIILIEGINGTGDIYVTGSGYEKSVSHETYKTTIFVSVTNTILANKGLDPLGSTDKIMLGDFAYNANGIPLRNAIIIRDGAVLPDVQPVLSVEGNYPSFIPSATDGGITVIGAIDFFHGVALYRRM